MADRFYGAALGAQQPVQVTEAGSTTGLAIEVRINDTVYTRKLGVRLALQAILNYLDTKETNPIA